MLVSFAGDLPAHCDGVTLLEQRLDRSMLERWIEGIERRYARVEKTRLSCSTASWSGGLPPGERFVPTASSLTLDAAMDVASVGALLNELASAGVANAIEACLRAATLVDLDQSWVRRQYAPHHYPPLHAPHGWHQDGALGYDFAALGAHPPAKDGLLPMVTCWFPLGPCGSDAPGLEFVLQRQRRLLPVADLTDPVVRRTCPAEAFWRPVMEAGDVLLFCGDILHRTYVTPAMTNDRTSIELRLFRAERVPVRLAGDRFVSLGYSWAG